MENNIVIAAFEPGINAARTRSLWKIDRGMKLKLVGLTLPTAYQVHFANTPQDGEAVAVVATSDTVKIPAALLMTGQYVYAWIYLTPEDDVGFTAYRVTIPVTARPDVTDEEPTPEQQSALDQAIAALNAGVEAAEEAVQEADESAERAQASADAAAVSADRAEQAAATAGYMFVEVVNGRLIYTRTDNVNTDFSLDDGHLILEV